LSPSCESAGQSNSDPMELTVNSLNWMEHQLAEMDRSKKVGESMISTVANLTKTRAQCWKLYDFVKARGRMIGGWAAGKAEQIQQKI
jgi:hypothetical protein